MRLAILYLVLTTTIVTLYSCKQKASEAISIDEQKQKLCELLAHRHLEKYNNGHRNSTIEALCNCDSTLLADAILGVDHVIKRDATREQHLLMNGEPLLNDTSDDVTERYRLSYSEVWNTTYVITIEKCGELIILQRKTYPWDDMDNRSENYGMRDTSFFISLEQFDSFKQELDKCDYWYLAIDNGDLYYDGNHVTLEAFRKNKDHYYEASVKKVNRYDNAVPQFTKACRMLIEM